MSTFRLKEKMEEVINETKMSVLDRLSDTSEQCVVCGDVADGYHYGVLSCRGCNAFFRRAVTFNMNFTCRRGGNCLVDKSARCACRSCRLKKCEMKGMDRRAVQPKRDCNGGKYNNNNTVMTNDIKTSPGLDQSVMTNDLKTSPSFDQSIIANQIPNQIPNDPPRTSSPMQLIQLETIGSADSAFYSPMRRRRLTIENMDQQPLDTSSTVLSYPSPSIVPPPPPPPPLNNENEETTTFISRMVIDYKQQCKQRRAMLCTSIAEILSEECETGLKTAAIGDDYSAIFRVQMVLMFEWCEKLDEFRLLRNPYDKTRLLKAFALRYLLLDNLFYTVELGYYDRLVLVNNTFIIPGHASALYTVNETEMESRVKSLMYGVHTFRILDELSRPMLEMGISAGEMMALRLINLWNPGSVGLSNEALVLSQKASDRAVRELHLWYDEQKFSDVDMRLGNLLLLLPAFTRHAQNLFETVKLIPSFGEMFEWDGFMADLLRL